MATARAAMRPLRGNTRGFTLIELIVVMVLIAMVTSLAVPQIANMLSADQLKLTVRKLVGMIHQSAQQAQRYQVAYLLTYRPKERLVVAEPEYPLPGEENADKAELEQRRQRLQLADSVTIRDVWSWYGGLRPAEPLVLRLNANGSIEPTIIHLSKEDGGEMSLVLSPFLGKVQVMDGYVLAEKNNLFQ